MQRSKQQGVVMIMALFIVALVAVLSVAMMTRVERDTRRVTLIVRNAEMSALAEGSVTWAMVLLQHNLAEKKADRPVDQMPVHAPVLHVQSYTITSTIEDMQAKFNLNNLNDMKDEPLQTFMRLVHSVAPKLNDEALQRLAKATHEWVSPGTAEDASNRDADGATHPYRVPHKLMTSVTEFRLIAGVTPALYRALAPYITALPEMTKVNVATASPVVLMSLDQNFTSAMAKQVEEARQKAPFIGPQAFLNLPAVKQLATKPDVVTQSDYFLLETSVSHSQQTLRLYTLLKREATNAKPRVIILWQSKGQIG